MMSRSWLSRKEHKGHPMPREEYVQRPESGKQGKMGIFRGREAIRGLNLEVATLFWGSSEDAT